jgi:hypothetical protein
MTSATVAGAGGWDGCCAAASVMVCSIPGLASIDRASAQIMPLRRR